MDGNVVALPRQEIVVESDREFWAREITGAWQSTVEGILRTGSRIAAAKVGQNKLSNDTAQWLDIETYVLRPKLVHGEFIAMIENELPFNRYTAYKLMTVALDGRLSNVSHVKHLPPSWGTLYELHRLSDIEFNERFFVGNNRSVGHIRSDLERNEVTRWRRQASRAGKSKFPALIKPSDNWNFSPVIYERIDTDRPEGHGYIPGDLYANALWYWTKPGDHIVAPMAGAGQIIQVFEDRERWMLPEPWSLSLRCFDLTPRGPYRDQITQHDLLTGFPVQHADYVILDLPYYGMVNNQYSSSPHDIANFSTSTEWADAIHITARSCASAQPLNALCTVISPNYRDVSTKEIFLAARAAQAAFELAGYALADIAYASRRIQQDQNPLMALANNAAKEHRVMLTDISEIMTFKRC